ALDAEVAGGAATLELSRDQLAFAVRPGRTPRAQTLSLRKAGGGAVAFAAAPDARWILLSKTEGQTPARLSVRVDPKALGEGRHEGHVAFTAAGASVRLTVVAQVGQLPLLAVQGDGCAFSEGRLRA